MAKYRRLPLSSIDEFKWHTKIIKTFGKKALILYTAFPKNGAEIDESILNPLITDEKNRSEVLQFMLDNSLIEVAEGSTKDEPKKETKKVVSEKIEEPEQKKEIKEKRSKKDDFSISYEPQNEIEIKPDIEPEEMEEPKKKSRSKVEEIQSEIEPEEFKEEPKKQSKKKEEPEEIQPEIEPEEEEEPKKQSKKKEVKEEIEPEEETKPEEKKTPEDDEIKSENEEAEPEEAKEELTPAEMIVHDKYGDSGVQIFRMIDGKRSVAVIAKESNVTQEKVTEVLKYLDEVGLISLGGSKGEVKEEKKIEEGFAPLSEDNELSTMAIDEQKEGIKNVKIKSVGLINNLKVKFSIVFKYGKSGKEILDFITSKKETNIIHLVIKLNIPLNVVEDVLNFLKSEKCIEISLMGREEMKKSFGYDAYIIYKRYGKKGVIFYEVIDKDLPLKKIAELISEKEASKIIEIFRLIRDVLGIELPINEDAIKKELI